MEIRRIVKFLADHELISITLLLAFEVLIFLSPSIVLWRYFAPVDIIRNTEPFFSGSKPHNFLLTDVLFQFLPWFRASRALLLAGHFPLWNIYSGGGLPLFGNMQSAILFPLSWAFFIFPMKLALWCYTGGKLFAIGFFTYLYLRAIQCSKSVAAIGATAFMFAGFNIVWLLWPHTNVVFVLPLGMYLIENYFQSFRIRTLLYFSLALASGIFAGHPETFFYIAFVLGCYVIYKSLLLQDTRIQKLWAALKFFGLGLLGAGLAAILLIPFFEYLRYSQALLNRSSSANGFYLPKLAILTNAIPDFFGNPAIRHIYYGTFTNYNESAMGYVGICLIILAIGSVFWLPKNKLIWFYGAVILFCLSVVYHVRFIFETVIKLPGFKSGANHRLLLVVAFCLTVMGCLALEHIKNNPFKKLHVLVITSAVIVCVLALSFEGWRWTLQYASNRPLHLIGLWQAVFVCLFILDAICIAALLCNLTKPRVLLLLGILVFIETGVHGMIYNSATKTSDFYPEVPATKFLEKGFTESYGKTFFFDGILSPNLGTWYRINDIADYDAVYLHSYEVLKQSIGSFTGSPEILSSNSSLAALKFLGVKWFVTESGNVPPAAQSLPVVYTDSRVTVFGLDGLPRAYMLSSASLAETSNLVSGLIKNPDRPDLIIPVSQYSLDIDGTSRFITTMAQPGYAILNENYMPGWSAWVDGKPVVVESVNGLKTFAVPSGTHSVRVAYNPTSFKVGLIISLVSAALWMLLWILGRRKKAERI